MNAAEGEGVPHPLALGRFPYSKPALRNGVAGVAGPELTEGERETAERLNKDLLYSESFGGRGGAELEPDLSLKTLSE